MPEIPYRTLVWLTYRLAATFAMGVPLALLIWASLRREASMVRLLTIYWKISSLFAISLLLLADQRPIGYITSSISPLLMVISVWFWVDLNEELADLPPWRALPFTVRLWRWALTGFGLLAVFMSFTTFPCIKTTQSSNCLAWIEAPHGFHQSTENLFGFLFGAQWTEPVAAFVGYLALVAYAIGLLQWLLIRLPKQGRVAGDF